MSEKRLGLLSIAILASIVVPLVIALSTVKAPGTLQITSDNPTPLGYTWSLLLFIVPLIVLGVSFMRQPRRPLRRRAFWRALIILSTLGLLLDVLFGNHFFVFENRGAVCGLEIPAVGGGIPVEEMVFYFSGIMLVLLLYIWNDEYWLAAYSVKRNRAGVVKRPRIVQFHLESIIIGAVLWVVAVVYKKLFSAAPEGMPWYLGFLLVVAFIPSAGFFAAARRFINWRAFSVTSLMIVLISLVWETSLGVPYAWWGYREEMMVGIFIGAWHGLPIEAVLLWLAVTYTGVILFEICRIFEASRRPVVKALLGQSQSFVVFARSDARRSAENTVARRPSPLLTSRTGVGGLVAEDVSARGQSRRAPTASG